MKKTVLLALMVAVSVVTMAQPKMKFDKEEMKAQKVAYITEKVQLTPDEAQQFWPLYNELQEKIRLVHKQRHELEKSLDEASSAADYERVNDAMVQSRMEMATLRKTYYEKYKQVLSAEKIHRLFKAEHGFKRVLLDRFEKK